MHPLALRTRAAVQRYELWPPGARVAVALSGGADSVALLHLLLELAAHSDLTVAGVIHVNHQLRGSASDADAEFCRAVAAECGVPAIVQSADVAAARAARRGSLEAIARTLRYEALTTGAAELDASRVAVGHTRDDQAETVLLKLLRGAGPAGLAGIHPRRGLFVRPLLGVARETVRQYLVDGGWAWREDATNQDVVIARNRIRHELLPYLESFTSHIAERLAATAELCREDAALLDSLAEAQCREVCSRQDDAVALLDRARLVALPRALSSRIVRTALGRVSSGRWAGFAEVEAVLHVASGRRTSADLPGAGVERLGANVVLRRSPPTSTKPESFSYVLPVPGTVSIVEAACRIEAECHPACPVADVGMVGPAEAIVALPLGPLVVRSWRPGDRLRPLGLGGRKKLHDLFVDRKVPREKRGQIPVVVDAANHVVWVAGYAISDEFRVTDPANPVVILRLRQLSGGRY